ncbi:ATP-dependent helicase, partial [Phytophthora palmivora]
MVLGVKESVSGKLYRLTADGAEERVCGGKGAVYLSGPKVALRCCGKTSIVATRQTKQSILRQGDVLLLGLRDAFYANGTLTKYEVVDTDAAPPKLALHVLPTRVPSITMSSAASNQLKKPKTSRVPVATGSRLVSSFFAKRNSKPSPKKLEKRQEKVEIELEDATASKSDEEEISTKGVKMQDLTVDSDVSSPREDDVFEKELENSTSAAKDWMAAFGRNGVKKHKVENSTVGSDGWKSRKDKMKPEKQKGSRRFNYESRNDYDDSDEDEHYSRSHDEVGQLLDQCEGI